MVALPNDSFWPRGDVISQRIIAVKKSIHQNRAAYVFQTRAETHREQRRPLLLDDYTPLTAWLLRQESLYRQQVAKPQPARPVSQPILNQSYTHVYHLHWGELPHNLIGNLAWKAVSFIGSFFDAWTAARA